MRVGDVCWVEFAPGAGRAQSGRRPAIVMQTEAFPSLPTVLLIPLTTQQDALRFPGTVLVEIDAENGLRRVSVALVFQMTAVDRRCVGLRTGAISRSVLESIWTALDELTDRVGR